MSNPNLIEDRIDLKCLTFDCFCKSIDFLKSGELKNISVGENTTIVILTNFGIMEGIPLKLSNTKDTPSEILINELIPKIFEIRNDEIIRLKEKNENLSLINDTSSILLKDVTIRPYSNPECISHIKYLTLFSDQIVGISFGEF
ncbi:hypothetical protein [Clostridium ihumii]|uniref:hypothetical protein n=1 Tax=Clostridium ihumii TaxID=1470356 RepID=UPI00055882AE|nr:hypothetical protein [Clostridium ihumii]